MSQRKKFVSIDSFSSEIIEAPAGLVIQGSKLSAVLYVNEITKIH